MPYQCDICEKPFSRMFNLKRHKQTTHNPLTSETQAKWKYKCVECNVSFKRNLHLMNHLTKNHNVQFVYENHVFANKIEFENWKLSMELENLCNFIMESVHKTAKGEVIYYCCNRTKRKGKPSPQKRKRQLKNQGSCKLNYACTSQMKLINNGKQLLCNLQKTHYGHDFDVRHLRLYKPDKVVTASQLFNRVIKTETNNTTDNSLKNVDNFTSENNNANEILQNNAICTGGENEDKTDAELIDLWVQNVISIDSEKNPILFYKREGEASDILLDEDFCLMIMNSTQKAMLTTFGSNTISVDGTHGLDYNIELTTVMVTDESGQGCPVAFMFSNRRDTYIYEIFFDAIKTKTGSISAKVFMTDMSVPFYHAWVKKMGFVGHHLYSSWHVDKAWNRYLDTIENIEKRRELYKALKVLQQEINEIDFENKLHLAVNLMLNDQDTQDFGSYFESHFLNYKQWAFCFQKSIDFETNSRLESMHKTINNYFLGRRKNNYSDIGLHSVLQFIRNESIHRISTKKVNNNKFTSSKEIFKRHLQAKKCEYSTTETEEGTCWEVKNTKEKQHVQKLNNSPCCSLICSECDICLHSYLCTCRDFTVNYTICKHIHYVMLRKRKEYIICYELEDSENSEAVRSITQIELQKNNDNELHVVEHSLLKLHDRLQHLDNVTLSEINDKLHKMLNDLPVREDEFLEEDNLYL